MKTVKLLCVFFLCISCTYPGPIACEGNESISEKPSGPLCDNPSDQLVWKEAGSCLIARGPISGTERWDCVAFLECSGAWACLPSDVRLNEGNPEACECGNWRP